MSDIEAWLEHHQPDPRIPALVSFDSPGAPATLVVGFLGGALHMDLVELVPTFLPTAEVNAHLLTQIADGIFDKSLLRAGLEAAMRQGAVEGSFIPWTSVQDVVQAAFVDRGFVPPLAQQFLQCYRRFDASVKGGLTVLETLCLVEALAALVVLAGVSRPRQSAEAVRVGGKSESVYFREMEELRAEAVDAGDGAAFAPSTSAVRATPPPSPRRPPLPSAGAQPHGEGLEVQSHVGDSILKTPTMTYLGEVQVSFGDLAPLLTSLVESNLSRGAVVAQVIEDGSLARHAVRCFQATDPAHGAGLLRWSAGEIQEFVMGTIRNCDLLPPTASEVLEVFSVFDDGGDGLLDVREAVCLVDAFLRALYHGIAAACLHRK